MVPDLLQSAHYIVLKLQELHPSVGFVTSNVAGDLLEIQFALFDTNTALVLDCSLLISEELIVRKSLKVDDQLIELSNEAYDCIYADAVATMARIRQGDKILDGLVFIP